MSKSDRAFERFHKDNPHIYPLFKKFAMQAREAGRRYFGARMIIERIRWYVAVETKTADFKINNDCSARYARMMIEELPEFGQFFRLRRLKG